MIDSERPAIRRITGLDLSLTSCGVGIVTRRVDGTCLATCTTVTSRGRRDDALTDRAARIAALADQVATLACPAELVVLEAPSFGSRGGSALDRYGLWWRVVHELTARRVPVGVCAPATRAKFATGSGRGDKAAVAAAVSRLWPELTVANADEADAVALAHLGAVRAGWPVVTLARHAESVGKVRWPSAPVGAVAVEAV